jgi:hypothetical protein
MWMQYMLVIYMASFLLLFSDFYYKAYIGQRSRAAKITSADAGAISNEHQEKDALHRNGATDAHPNRATNSHRNGATDTHLNGATNTHRNGYRSHANGGSK